MSSLNNVLNTETVESYGTKQVDFHLLKNNSSYPLDLVPEAIVDLKNKNGFQLTFQRSNPCKNQLVLQAQTSFALISKCHSI
jgi:hypothetical protein